MARARLTAFAVERAQRSGNSVLLSDGDGLYLRKQTRDGASWTLRYAFAGKPSFRSAARPLALEILVESVSGRSSSDRPRRQDNVFP